MKKIFFIGIFIFLFICLNPVFCKSNNYEKWHFKNIENSIPRGTYIKLNDDKILVTTSQGNNYIYNPSIDKSRQIAKFISYAGLCPKTVANNGNVIVAPYEYTPDKKNSQRLVIFNPNTETFNYGVRVPFEKIIYILNLNDGNLLFIGKAQYAIYSPEKNYFFETNNNPIDFIEPIILDDGKIISKSKSLNNFIIIDLATKKYKETLPEKNIIGKYLKLLDGRILYTLTTDSCETSLTLKIYNPKNNETITAGEMIIPRLLASQHFYNMDLLKDGKVLISGGYNCKRSGFFMGDMPENRLEIFNPITGQSKVLKERQYFINQQPILLNDSRIFFGYPQRIFEP
ncbi:hypothetical protein IKP85_00810 [bacterium]|nr:hypothetical protein [bacterium]